MSKWDAYLDGSSDEEEENLKSQEKNIVMNQESTTEIPPLHESPAGVMFVNKEVAVDKASAPEKKKRGRPKKDPNAPKKPLTEKQLKHLDTIRLKSAVVRKANAEVKRLAKEEKEKLILEQISDPVPDRLPSREVANPLTEETPVPVISEVLLPEEPIIKKVKESPSEVGVSAEYIDFLVKKAIGEYKDQRRSKKET